MATPSSGTISLLDLRNNLGRTTDNDLGDYYKSGYSVGTNVGGAGSVPTSGALDLTDFYNLPQNLSYSQATSPLVTSTGNPSNNPSLNLSSYLTGKQKSTGNTFTIVTLPNAGSFWAYYSDFVTTFTYGTAQTFTSPSTGSKSTYRRIKYDGANTVDFYCYYSGSDTNYKESGCYLSEIRY